MQLAAALLGIFGVILPITVCEKKEVKKHTNKTRPSPNKRWMSSFAQNFIKSQPVQRYTTRYNQDLYNGPPDPPNNHYEFGDGNMAQYDDSNYQGMKEIKIPKQQTEPHNQDDATVTFASDIAQLLKPGIGDDPSDMPGGLKSYGTSLNGVGLPITGKLRSTKLNPVASYAEQTGDDMAHKVLLAPTTAVIPAVIADSIRSDSSTSKLLDEMPGKISEVSASEAESSKAFTGAGESSMIVSSNADTTSTALASATDNSVTAQIDTNETANSDQPATTSSVDKTSDKGKQEASITENTEVKDGDVSPEKANEAGITNDSDQPSLKAKKPKQVTGHPTKFNDTSKKHPGHRRQNSDSSNDDGSSTKAVEVSSDKDASLSEETQNNSTNEEEGDDEAEKTPSKVKEKLVSSLREALLENVKEMLNGENSKQLLEEAQTVTDDKPYNGTNQDDDDGSAESVALNKEIGDSHFVEDESSASDEVKVKAIEGKAGNLLENNLMKIDKKKLVHLLATLMKRYKSNAAPSSDTDVEGKSDEKSDEKGKEVFVNNDDKNNEKNNPKLDEKSEEALKEETNKDRLKDDKVKEERLPTENKQMKLNKQKHQNAVSRMAGLSSDFFDPYAQIGLTDPKVSGNPAVTNRKVEETPTGRHSVHINLFGDEYKEKEKDSAKSEDAFKPSKEFEGKVEAETQRAEEIVNEKVEKQKARLEEAVQKAHSKESLENEELVKENKGIMKLSVEEAHKDIKDLESEKELSALKLMENMKVAHMKPESIIENGLVKANNPNGQIDVKEADKVMENTKGIDENESSLKQGSMNLIQDNAEREKTEAMKEAQNVQAELEKEREELKMLREQEKLEKAKEEELRLANIELEEKDKKARAAFLEKVKLQQMKDSKQEEDRENKNMVNGTKEGTSEIPSFKKVTDLEAKSQKLSDEERMAGKAEFTAEKGEKELEKAEKDTSSQLNLGKVISEEKLHANENNSEDEKIAGKVKVNSENIPGKLMLAKSGEKDKDLKITVTSEENKNKNTKDEPTEKTKENELKAVESMLEEKEKKVKSMNKEKDEELNRKEMELKEAQKEVELERKKDNGKQEQNTSEMESKGKEDKAQSKVAENYNAIETKPTILQHNRYIHIVSPELVNAIENKVPSHIVEAEKESSKVSTASYPGDNIKGGDQEKDVAVGLLEKTSMGVKEPVGEKARKAPGQQKEGMDERGNKASMNSKSSTDAKQDKLSRDAKGSGKSDEKTEGNNYDQKEKEKGEKLKDQETKERNEEFMAIDGPNIETLIEHMEERMRLKKKEKENAKEAVKYSKEIRKKSGYQDDAYAQIGSMDPNVKRRRISKKMKKHYHHHHLKNKTHLIN